MRKPRPSRRRRDSPALVLAGDVGGTKTLIGLYRAAGRGLRPHRMASFASGDHESLESIVASFLAAAGSPPIAAACFGVAGPVIAGEAQLTNLPWRIRERNLAAMLKAKSVRLVNDVQAAAAGMLHMDKSMFAMIKPGRHAAAGGNNWPAATMAVIAPGTGLGEARLHWDGKRHIPLPSEGGHVGFAPRGKLETEFLGWLAKIHGTHVSCERIVSGPGLVSIYEFLRTRTRSREATAIARARATGDLAAAIGTIGVARNDPTAAHALDMFVSILGAEAGNLALLFFAVGGVLIGGGIPPKILPALLRPEFAKSFTDKGRFAPLLRDIPVWVCRNPDATLLGAAHIAADKTG